MNTKKAIPATHQQKSHFAGSAFLALAIVSAGLMTGCETKPKDDPLAGGGGLAGNWVSSDNIFTAHFNDGAFTATANDTGNTISRGTYVVASATTLQLDWHGEITGKNNSATCQRPDVERLDCTDSAGRQFTLIKQG